MATDIIIDGVDPEQVEGQVASGQTFRDPGEGAELPVVLPQAVVDVLNAGTRAYHDRKIGTTVRCLVSGESRKDAKRLAAKSLDNVTVIAPKPPGYDEGVFAREPWIDVAVETAHVWGCTGTIVRRARAFADPGSPVERAPIDLVGAR